MLCRTVNHWPDVANHCQIFDRLSSKIKSPASIYFVIFRTLPSTLFGYGHDKQQESTTEHKCQYAMPTKLVESIAGNYADRQHEKQQNDLQTLHEHGGDSANLAVLLNRNAHGSAPCVPRDSGRPRVGSRLMMWTAAQRRQLPSSIVLSLSRSSNKATST